MTQKPVLHGDRQMPEPGTLTSSSALPNELFSVIRSIVPPPPDEISCKTTKMSEHINDSTSLFKRRPNETYLLKRGGDTSSFSAMETETFLEDIFIQLVEPNKYSDGDKILHVVLELMIKWKLDIAVQEQAFKCLACLSQQCNYLQPPPPTIPSVLSAMKCFHRFEKIQRMGVKILKSRTFLGKVNDKVQVAHLIFTSLCNLPEMEDFMLHAKEIVQELNISERSQIRSHKQYVEMLLDFPDRKTPKVTVFLSWCALETLILLAESDERWPALKKNGEDKLWRMSCRPELEDRCQTLLKRISPLAHDKVVDKRNEIPLKLMPCESVYVTQQLSKILDEPFEPFLDIEQILKTGKVEKDHFSQLPNKMSSDLLPDGNAIKLLPVDEFMRSQPQTPDIDEFMRSQPQTPDIDERLFDDMLYAATPAPSLYTITSPSYSPPPETYALIDQRLGVPSSLPSEIVKINVKTKSPAVNNRDKEVSRCTKEVVPSKSETMKASNLKAQQKLSGKIVQCLFCNEPKAKRPLLETQYNDVAHCLLQPRNNMLYKLLQSNLCDLHKMR